jgi:glycine/D-amino acid oxidase-like deaminating enzyme
MTASHQDNVPPAAGLAALEARLRQDLSWLELPPKAWTLPHVLDGRPVLDVAVIGGGMAGLAAAASLKHLGIGVVVFDRAPVGFEGPWATTARMETLRSPKQLTGPALGLPALTFRAWFEAQFGTEAWETRSRACNGWTTCAGTAACCSWTCATNTSCRQSIRARTVPSNS